MASPWGYRRAFRRCGLLLAAGVTLQLIFGPMDNAFLRYPWGLVVFINYLYLLILGHALRGRWRWLRQLSDHYACVASIACLTALVLVFGLTKQGGDGGGLLSLVGFTRMTSSWAFNLTLLHFTTIMGLVTVADIAQFRWSKLASTLSHAGIFLLLAAGLFGSADMQRVSVQAVVGQETSKGITGDGLMADLPFSIRLHQFDMEEYPPKIYLYDSQSGTLSRQYLEVEAEGAEAEIDGWLLRAEKSIDMAGHSADSTGYREMKHVGAAPAVRITATHRATQRTARGWVSCGSHIFEPAHVELDATRAVVMPRREPKRYLSHITLTEAGGQSTTHNVEVNHPVRVGSWRIYQKGYDNSRGRWSSVSVLECVNDPWYPAAHIALLLLLAAGVVMFLTAGGKHMAASKNGKEAKS